MSAGATPSVLLATTAGYIFPARLAMVLADAGFSVEAVCPRGHFLASTSAVKRLYHYGALRGVSSLRSALLKAKPSLVIPCDDLARYHLHRLYEDGGTICEVIRRSLGEPASYPDLESRSRMLTLARREVEEAVETTPVSSPAALKEWLAANGLHAVLKTDGSSGGYGVCMVSTAEEAEMALRKLASPPGLARAIKRALVNHNQTFLLPAWKKVSPVVNAQKFIPGAEATSTAVCWQGEVRAMLTFEVLRTMYPGGPASVVRHLENKTINNTVRKTAARLGISGICGFDFILEKATGIPYLIELNPRATQTVHLRMGVGRDAANALYAAVTGDGAREPVNEINSDTIALFPQEWQAPSGEFPVPLFHDMPRNEPALLKAIAASEGKRL